MFLLVIGSFWEASMDVIGNKHNYDHSIWKKVADFFERKNYSALGNNFWDNSVAWKNKWKSGDPNQGEKFPGSSTLFVILMDGWHVVKITWLMHMTAAIICYQPFTPYIALDFLLLYTIFSMGHEFFFRIIQSRNEPPE